MIKNAKIEHESLFGRSLEDCKEIQNPLMEELKRKYKLGVYKVEYCKKCTKQKSFKVKKNTDSVEGYFECEKCNPPKWDYSNFYQF